ncbi:MAG: nucleotidyltransferase family protein [Gemmatimonadales bacterium]
MPEHVSSAAIVLAAGASRRMGRNKMLIRVDGESLVRRAVRRAILAQLSPVIVVVGHEPEQVRSELVGLACECVVNRDFAGPTSASLHRGLEALGHKVDSAVLLLADMPFVTVAMLQDLARVARDTPAPLAASRYGDVLAPPLLFRRSLFDELRAWHGEGCGKQVVLQHRHEAVYLDWPAAALTDIDTPKDLAALGAADADRPDSVPPDIRDALPVVPFRAHRHATIGS